MSKIKIYEKDIQYNLLRPYVDWCTASSYRKVEVAGKENIPPDGAVILAPNHCNTLMDALVILRAFKDESVFGARADMFSTPLVAKIMFFLRILPMVRQRDGIRNVLKNNDTQQIIIETLENNVRFCIFPEGRHRAKHSLLPLGKGISRIAVAANRKFGDKKPVYIVPVGIEYGDYFRSRSTSLVKFGKPLNVTAFLAENKCENEAREYEAIRQEIGSMIANQITFIPDTELYDEKWALLKVMAQSSSKNKNKRLSERLKNNKHIAKIIEAQWEKHPDKMGKLLEKVGKFEKRRRERGISIYSFRHSGVLKNLLCKTLLAIVGFSFFVFGVISSLPLWLTIGILKGKIRDRAFHNTVSFGVKLVMYPILLILWSAIFLCTLPYYIAIPAIPLSFLSCNFIYDYMEFARILISDYKLLFNKDLHKDFTGIAESCFIFGERAV